MWSPWRLPKRAIDQLNTPKLPEGYYFVMQKNSWVAVRRRKVWPFFASVDTEYAIFGSDNLVERYNYALGKLSYAAEVDAKRRYRKEGFMKGLPNESTY